MASAVRGSGRAVRPLAVEVPLPADSVALRKSLFERGDVASPTSPRGNPTRDVSGLNVGIASRISQWSNKNEEGTAKGSAARPSDIRPGDVSTKKSIWESKPSAGSPPEKSAAAPSKGNPSGKRFKFVMVAPGKYEKVPIDSVAGDNHFANGDDVIACDVIACDVIPTDVIGCDVIVFDDITCDIIVIPSDVIGCDVISCDVIGFDDITCDVIVIPSDVIGCDVIGCDVIPTDVITCDVIACDVIGFNDITCDVIVIPTTLEAVALDERRT
ncbi:unnamed protein product [Lampetra fluviatilis]